jgi:hypothetical protein
VQQLTPFRSAAAFGLVLALAACTVAVVETPDPGAIPTGPLEAAGDDATGPVLEVDSDVVAGIGWRLLFYESADGQCLQFETVSLAETGCGPLLPEEGDAFGSVAAADTENAGLRPIHGIVSADIATVFLIDDETQERVPAKLVSLEEAGVDASAFIGFQPEGMTITHLQAIKLSGEIVETYELP